MEKISIELNNEVLNVINSLWSEKSFYSHDLKAQKVLNNIKNLLADKFSKLAISKRHKTPNETFQKKLEYYECYFLEIILRQGYHNYDKYSYEANALLNLANEINQKLA